MGAVRLIRVPLLPNFPLLPPHSRFVLWWGVSAGLGHLPHLLYQAMHEGCALLLGGCLPFPYLVRCQPPLPLMHAMRKECTLIGGCPPFALLVRGPPPLPLLHAVRWERTLFGGCPPFALLVRGSLSSLSCMS